MSNTSLVSVIVPTYNRSWALERSVGSIFDQTYRPIECIIVDDGSTDNTGEIIQRLISKCPKDVSLKYFKKENGGANSARNRGLQECTGHLISQHMRDYSVSHTQNLMHYYSLAAPWKSSI